MLAHLSLPVAALWRPELVTEFFNSYGMMESESGEQVAMLSRNDMRITILAAAEAEWQPGMTHKQL